jgi:methionine biosynthesis protein MetW
MNLRRDLELIADWVRPGAHVLDLGCGDGTLLAYLAETKGVTGYGIEIDPDNIARCIAHGIDVIHTDLDRGLQDFEDEGFDYVIMTQSLQALHYPVRVLEEMLRIGREAITSFPNMGHWQCRLQFALRGRMPVTRALDNEWYNTPNIHLCSIADFEDLCRNKHIGILQRAAVDYVHRSSFIIKWLPNLLAEIALYRFRKM